MGKEFRIVVTGADGCGKTSLIVSFVNKPVDEDELYGYTTEINGEEYEIGIVCDKIKH